MNHGKLAGIGDQMEIYQIRILRNGREITAEACKQASDYAAIRHARSLAQRSLTGDSRQQGCDHVEVWRGGQCLFTGSPMEHGS